MPDVLAVIVTYNSADVVGALLDSLPEACGELRHHVVVVDNGSTDSTLAVVAGYPGCQVVESSNVGYAGGINRGVAAGPASDAILVLNPDLILEAGSVAAMMQSLSRRGVGVVAPQVRSPDGSLQRSLRRDPTLLRAVGLGRTSIPLLSEYCASDAEYVRACDVDWALGAVLLISRRCHEALGGWDESFFLHSEETDFCLRARAQGWRTFYEPSARAVHVGRHSGYSPAVHTMQIVNRVRLYHRHHGTAASWTYYGLTVLSELSWLARGNTQSRASLAGLLVPGRRPPEIRSTDRLLPA